MATNIITLDDLDLFKNEFFGRFKEEFLEELKEHLLAKDKIGEFEKDGKRWLKSDQVQRMLKISPGTLQNLRVNRKVPYSKVGGNIFYAYEDIVELLEKNKFKAI